MIGKTVKTPRKFRLRTTLVVPFVLQILAAAGLVGYLSFRNGQKAVNDLATQLRSEITARIEAELKTYLSSPHDFNRLNAAAFSEGNFDMATARNVKQFLTQVQVSPFIYSTYCGDSKGQMLSAIRRSQQGSDPIAILASNAQTNFHGYLYALDNQGNRQRILEKLGAYDPRKRPWYEAAVRKQQPIWSEVYLDFSSKLPTITASTPVYDKSGSFSGVCAADVVLLQDLRKFLSNLSIGQTGEAFVIDRSGSMLSSSTDEPLTVGEGEKAKLVVATESENPLVRETADYLQQRFGGFDQIQRLQQIDYRLKGERQFVQVLPLNDERGLDWLIVVVVPEADFMGQIYANTRNTIGLTLAALGVAIVLGILTARWITRPILRISQASNKLAQGDLDQQVAPSSITEINALADSFNTMTRQLQGSFDAVQQSEKKFRGLVANIPGAIYRSQCDADMTMEYISDAIKTISGYPASDFIHQVRTYSSIIHPDDCDLVEVIINHGIATQEPYVLDYRVLHRDGSIRWVYEQGRVVFDADDNPLYLDGAIFDITDRKRAEEALRITEENYRSIFENALEGIFQSSPEGRFISVNPALARIYGYDSPKEMIESITNIGEQLYVDPEKRAELRELLETKGAAKDFEYRCYCKDSSIIWTQIDARVVRDSNDEVLYYEGIVQDITDRKRREDELRRQLEELRIEIDQKKREKEVAMLTESSYFQEVQQEIAEVNLDEFWG